MRRKPSLEHLPPRELLEALQADPKATAAILAYLDAREIPHSGLISGGTLASVCGVDARTWRKWLQAGELPTTAARLLASVARG